MPSLLCYHCTKPKRCTMVLERGAVAYLCKRCARELGYAPRYGARPCPTSPHTTISALRGQEARS